MNDDQLQELISAQNDALRELSTLLVSTQGSVDALIQTVFGGIVSALVGAGAAYCLARKHYSLELADRKREALIERLVGAIGRFEHACSEYWTRDFNPDSEKYLHGQIIIHQKRLFGLIGAYSSLKHLDFFDQQQIDAKYSELYDEATGGDFGVKGRLASAEKQNKISDKCDALLDCIRL